MALAGASRLILNAVAMRDPRLTLALYQPEIAANAGAILRTCACLGADAAIIEPCGFPFSDRRFRRSGMDYLDALNIARYSSYSAFDAERRAAGRRLALLSTRGEVDLWGFAFRPDDALMVGQESVGVPEDIEAAADVRLRIPIEPPLRSLNVSVAAAIVLAEAQRQLRKLKAEGATTGA